MPTSATTTAKRLTSLIEVFGQVAGKDRGYRDLVDQVSDFVAKRTGESQGALALLKRANQLYLDENIEMIRLLGRVVRPLSRKEHVEDFVHAQALLAVAYRSAGLLWAARASCTSAAATLFIEADESGELPASILPAPFLRQPAGRRTLKKPLPVYSRQMQQWIGDTLCKL